MRFPILALAFVLAASTIPARAQRAVGAASKTKRREYFPHARMYLNRFGDGHIQMEVACGIRFPGCCRGLGLVCLGHSSSPFVGTQPP